MTDSLDPWKARQPTVEFLQHVRNVLAHLYDPAYLLSHPFATYLDAKQALDSMSRAQKVRRVLIECIESLQSQKGDAAEARAHAVLSYRYVDGLTTEEVAAKLALSPRQIYREHARGVEAVANQLWDALHLAASTGNGPEAAAPNAGADRLSIAEAEVERLRHGASSESLHVSEVLSGACRLLQPRFQTCRIELAMNLPEAEPAVVADRTLLRQALVNLLSHAIDVVGEGRLDVHLEGQAGDLLIDIQGSAVLCPQPHPVSQPRGVRLKVARELLEAQGGRLSIDTGDGWQAQILLPVRRVGTVLVVDDNDHLITLFQRYLGGHPISVVGITEGSQALQAAQTLRPHLIVLDVMLPDQDGWEVLQQLKDDPAVQEIPVVVCSVLHEPQLAAAMGASDSIVKPVGQVELLTVVQRWLGIPVPAG